MESILSANGDAGKVILTEDRRHAAWDNKENEKGTKRL